MTLNAALSNALSGLTAGQIAIEVRSHNIANAGTVGYARRDPAMAARPQSGGVIVAGIDRAEAGRALSLARGAASLSQEMAARSAAAGDLFALFGEPGDQRGLTASFTRFETALADLAATPEAESYQHALLSAAKDLSGTFNRLGDDAQTVREEADAGIANGVASVNLALTELAALNERQADGRLSDLPERRQALIDQIAAELDIRVRTDERGKVTIATSSGVPLLGDAPHLLSFRPAGAITAEQSTASGHLSGLSVGGIDLTPGATQGIATGRLAGLFSVRDDTAPAFAGRLDDLATDLAARFSAADSDAAGGLLQTDGGSGAASRMRVSERVDPVQGGELYRLRDGLGANAPGPSAAPGVLPALGRALASSGGFAGTLAAASSVFATSRIAADRAAEGASVTASGLADDVLSRTGVNTDQELQGLLLIEQAYAANARVVQVVSDMMARLMEL